jgi:hypothetical protein
LCETGELGPGLLWLVRALETVPAGDDRLGASLRLLLGGWGRQLHTLEGRHVFPGKVRAVGFFRSQELGVRGQEEGVLVVACEDRVHFWDVGRQKAGRAAL